MTNDYKVNLLKYFTDNLEIETGVNTPQFNNFTSSTNDLFTTLINEFNADRIDVQGYLFKNDVYLVYGKSVFAGAGTTVQTPFIIILDKEFNLLQTITQFNSGTSFRFFCYLNIDEEGQLYGVDCDDEDDNYRFILLNNVFASNIITGQYSVNLRNSYYFPSAYNNAYYFSTVQENNLQMLQKSVSEAKYLFVGRNKSNNRPVFTSVKINVGSTNDWDNYTASSYENITESPVSINVDWTSESGNYNYVDLFGVSTNYIQLRLQSGAFSLISNVSLPSNSTIYGTVFLNDNIYCIGERYTVNSDNIYTYTISLLEMSTSTYTVLDKKTVVSDENAYYDISIIVNLVSDTICMYIIYDNKINIGIATNEKLYISEQYNYVSPGQTGLSFFTVSNLYNLFNFTYQSINTRQKSIFIYNSNNYNGLSYSDTNMLVPNSGLLYGDDSSLIFARNLYNKVVDDNMTVSTIQIPNTLLNGVNIANERLLGQTNLTLNNENISLSKNVYEYLNINFYNTLQMVNRNTSEDIINLTGATRINDSISQTTDYEDATMNKAKINYGDGTNYIFPIYFRLITNGANTNFYIYVEKEILSIDLISNDEATVYNTITGDFEIGKFYNISQDVTIEDMTLNVEQLYYNNEPVQYNSNNIYVVGGE